MKDGHTFLPIYVSTVGYTSSYTNNRQAVEKFEATVARLKAEGGRILVGGQRMPPDQLDAGVAKARLCL